MTTTIIVTLCILILLAYIFDLSSKYTKVPTVIFLLILGWLVKQTAVFFEVSLPDLKPLLPILGTVGLILIVLEGGLELELNSSKSKILKKTALSAFVPLVVLSAILASVFSYMSGKGFTGGFMDGLVNAIPLCVFSSAIAIPSVQNLSENKREFVIYETSFSDIFGVILFNFFLTNTIITLTSVGDFFLQIVIILIISFIASISLSLLIKKIDHKVKFIPMIMMIILIYDVSKIYHLPSLIFILIFGLFLNNLDELKHLSFIKWLEPEKLDKEVHRFKEIVIEVAFLVRSTFFLLFGFLIDANSLLDLNGLMIASAIVISIVLIRFFYLKIIKVEIQPLLFVVPRGLITILLFLSIPTAQRLPFITESLTIQVILLSSLVMMFGLMFHKKKEASLPATSE